MDGKTVAKAMAEVNIRTALQIFEKRIWLFSGSPCMIIVSTSKVRQPGPSLHKEQPLVRAGVAMDLHIDPHARYGVH
jgi:hypothetical protein